MAVVLNAKTSKGTELGKKEDVWKNGFALAKIEVHGELLSMHQHHRPTCSPLSIEPAKQARIVVEAREVSEDADSFSFIFLCRHVSCVWSA